MKSRNGPRCLAGLLLLFTLGGCSSPADPAASSAPIPVTEAASAASSAASSAEPPATATPETDMPATSAATAPVWDNSPKVLTPVAAGTELLGNETLTIDISNKSEGYLMVQYTGSAARLKFFVITPAEVRYTYDIYPTEGYTTIPLTAGDGHYLLDVREHVEADLYANYYEAPLEITLHDEFRPFLYPNQYSYFTAEYTAVQTAAELAAGAADELAVIGAVYDYIIKHVTYDEEKAENVRSGYLPDIDETLATGRGICFDYAALFTAMLRSQGIPTKLEIGYSGEIYHAWISVYAAEHGWIDNILEFDGENWELMDPTLAANNDSRALNSYIGDGTNYTVKYSR